MSEADGWYGCDWGPFLPNRYTAADLHRERSRHEQFRKEYLGRWDPPGPMRQDRDTWLFTDEHGDVYRLRPTGERRGCPLTITPERWR